MESFAAQGSGSTGWHAEKSGDSEGGERMGRSGGEWGRRRNGTKRKDGKKGGVREHFYRGMCDRWDSNLLYKILFRSVAKQSFRLTRLPSAPDKENERRYWARFARSSPALYRCRTPLDPKISSKTKTWIFKHRLLKLDCERTNSRRRFVNREDRSIKPSSTIIRRVARMVWDISRRTIECQRFLVVTWCSARHQHYKRSRDTIRATVH